MPRPGLSPFPPGKCPVHSSGYHVLNIVLLEPPAPAALVLLGRAFALFSFRSAAARLLMAVAGPPGGFGDDGRAEEAPELGALFTGEFGRGADYSFALVLALSSSWVEYESARMSGARDALVRIEVVWTNVPF